MELIQGSDTSANYNLTPGKYPKEHIQYSNHGESLKSRRSTTFPHKDIHKETQFSADSRTANQIDHDLIGNRFRSAITDIRALRGPDIGSDHDLLKINFKVKLRAKTEKKYNEKRKIVNIFQHSKWKQEYDIELNNRFEILENVEDNIDDINEKWENIKTIIKETKSPANRKG